LEKNLFIFFLVLKIPLIITKNGINGLKNHLCLWTIFLLSYTISCIDIGKTLLLTIEKSKSSGILLSLMSLKIQIVIACCTENASAKELNCFFMNNPNNDHIRIASKIFNPSGIDIELS